MSKQMSATSCSGQAVHPVELLRDGKGVFGIIGHGDDDHEHRELILRPDLLANTPSCYRKPIYQQICGGFRHGMFAKTVEEQFRQSIHHNMLRRAGLDWPPTDQRWWSDDKKQQDRNRQIYHGFRLGSLSVLNSLIRTALAEAADQDALKMARRFTFKDRQCVYTAAAMSRRALQLFDTFPVLGLAIFGEGSKRSNALAAMAVERGRKLKHIAGLMEVPMALQRVKPGAAPAALDTIPFFRDRPGLVYAYLPGTRRKMKSWFQAVKFAAGRSSELLVTIQYYAGFAEWTARHVFGLGCDDDTIGAHLSDIKDWVQACHPAPGDDIFGSEPPNVFVTREFHPDMSLATVTQLSAEWHEAVANSQSGPEFAFPEPWIPTRTVDGLEFSPITQSGDLHREGAFMHHCVSTYAGAILHGQSFVYSVRENNTRVATLELVAGDRQIALGQLRGPCNAAVAPAIQKSARKWLRQSSIPQNWAEIIGKTSETEHQHVTDTEDEIPF